MTYYTLQASQRTAAKVAGFGFLVLFLSGIYTNFIVDPKIIVDGDAAKTASHILVFETLFRTGIAAALVMFNCDIILAIAFYTLLKPINRSLALLGMFWRFANACIGGFSLLNKFQSLQLVVGHKYLTAFSLKQLNALITIYLHDSSNLICLVFFSLGMAVHGYLLFKSNYIPQVLSGFYLFAALVILISCFVIIIFPDTASIISPAYIIPDFFSELFVALWFLFKGIKTMKPTEV